MSVAIRTATRIQDQDDLGSVPGAGNDGYALTWDNGAGEFVLASVTPDLSGYALLAGRSGGQTLYGGTAAGNNLTLYSTSHATKGNIALGTTLTVDSVNGRVGIGISAPANKLDIVGAVKTRVAASGDSSGIEFGASASERAVVVFRVSNNDLRFKIEVNGVGTSQERLGFFHQPVSTPFEYMSFVKGGYIGIGTTSPATILHALTTDTATNAVTNVVTVGHNTSGTAAAGFGGGLAFNLQSSTTASQSAAAIKALWYEATHATRKADLVLTAYDTAEREGLRIRGDGSAPAIGFYGVAPIARATLATGAGASVDDVITALQNLGLVKQV